MEQMTNEVGERRTERSDVDIRKLLEENRILSEQKSELERILEGILSSRSWRLTESLRRFGGTMRAVWPLWRRRRHKLRLSPDNNVSQDGDRFTVHGSSPSLRLATVDGSLPTGWMFLESSIKAKIDPLFFLLYHSHNSSFDPNLRFWITLGREVSRRDVFRLPRETKNLRLDPFNSDLTFEVEKLNLVEIGILQVVGEFIRRHLRGALRDPRILWHKARRLIAILREGGLTALRVRLFANDFTSNYQEWVEKYDTLDENDRRAIRARLEKLPYQPLISIIMPVYNVPERWLRLAIESVLGQLYRNWELCIADDASTAGHIRAVLDEFAKRDSRIKVTYRSENGHISAASNSALALATGEFIALVDNDDELTEHALALVVEELNSHPNADLIYSDEDKLTSYGMRFNPYFKSDWNPDLILQQNFICHLGVYRRELVNRLGGFRRGLEGAQDWDLALRVVDASSPERVRHIPHVLYHWRVIESSTAHSTSSKPYVMEAQRRAVTDHLERNGVRNAEVKILDTISQLRVRRAVPDPAPLVSIIIPTRDKCELLKRCIESLFEKSSYRNFEILIVDNGSREAETLSYFDELRERKLPMRVIRDDKPFNYSRLNNDAAAHARGELLAFLNNDLEVISSDWLDEMVSHAVRPEVGAVGARLLYPNDLLQHGGVILGIGGVAGHNHKGRSRFDTGYFNRCILTQNLSAVTAACMVLRRDVFDRVGGFDAERLAVAFNDIDLCLKIRREGLLIVYTPYAELYHYESASRGHENTPEKFVRFESEIGVMRSRWGETLDRDPYYNPNLTLLTEDFAFSFPPRAAKPWRV